MLGSRQMSLRVAPPDQSSSVPLSVRSLENLPTGPRSQRPVPTRSRAPLPPQELIFHQTPLHPDHVPGETIFTNSGEERDPCTLFILVRRSHLFTRIAGPILPPLAFFLSARHLGVRRTTTGSVLWHLRAREIVRFSIRSLPPFLPSDSFSSPTYTELDSSRLGLRLKSALSPSRTLLLVSSMNEPS